MSSDADYASFLDKANADPSSGGSSSSKPKKEEGKGGGGISTKAVDKGAEVPAALKEVEGKHFYTSETDEPFEGVSLKWEGGSEGEDIGEDDFAKLIQHEGEVSKVSTKEFDPKGQYKEVLSAVEKVAGESGKVTIFRVGDRGTRAEYWIVAVEKGGKKIVGLKAAAVES